MAQLFPQWSNTLIRIGFVGLVSLPIIVPAILMIAVRTPYRTGVGIPRQQPVPFSHEHHAGALNIDCRYCHASVEESSFAGMPGTHVCMTCHSQLWTDAEMLAPVRQSLANHESLHWVRINNLPDYVYFDHSIHVNKGVGCVSCHGHIEKMSLTHATHAFHMSFCLGCHRQPEQALRPVNKVTAMGWTSESQAAMGKQLLKQYDIHTGGLTDCSICHR